MEGVCPILRQQKMAVYRTINHPPWGLHWYNPDEMLQNVTDSPRLVNLFVVNFALGAVDRNVALRWGIALYTTSIGTNAYSTMLIAYKFWRVTRKF